MKKQILEGIVLIPEKLTVPVECDCCGEFPATKILYSSKNGGKMRICFNCIQNKKRQTARIFTLEDKIHIGTKKHICGYGTNMFDEKVGAFSEKNGKTRYLKFFQCKKCGVYIVDGKTYEKNRPLFDQYVLIDTKSGKEIVKFNATGISHRPQIKKESDVPAHIQWAAKHPYQGGGCSGK